MRIYRIFIMLIIFTLYPISFASVPLVNPDHVDLFKIKNETYEFYILQSDNKLNLLPYPKGDYQVIPLDPDRKTYYKSFDVTFESLDSVKNVETVEAFKVTHSKVVDKKGQPGYKVNYDTEDERSELNTILNTIDSFLISYDFYQDEYSLEKGDVHFDKEGETIKGHSTFELIPFEKLEIDQFKSSDAAYIGGGKVVAPTVKEDEEGYSVSFMASSGVGAVEFIDQLYYSHGSMFHKVEVAYPEKDYYDQTMKVFLINGDGESQKTILGPFSGKGSGILTDNDHKILRCTVNGESVEDIICLNSYDPVTIELVMDQLVSATLFGKAFRRQYLDNQFVYSLYTDFEDIDHAKHYIVFNGQLYKDIVFDISNEKLVLELEQETFFLYGSTGTLNIEINDLDMNFWIDGQAVDLEGTDYRLPEIYRDGKYHQLAFYGVNQYGLRTKGYITNFLWTKPIEDISLYTYRDEEGNGYERVFNGNSFEVEDRPCLLNENSLSVTLNEEADHIIVDIQAESNTVGQVIIDGQFNAFYSEKYFEIPVSTFEKRFDLLVVDEFLNYQLLSFNKASQKEFCDEAFDLISTDRERKKRYSKKDKVKSESKVLNKHVFVEQTHDSSKMFHISYSDNYLIEFIYIHPMWFDELLRTPNAQPFQLYNKKMRPWIRVNNDFYSLNCKTVENLTFEVGEQVDVQLFHLNQPFNDIDCLSPADQVLIEKAYLLNWIHGYPDGSFRPKDMMTYGELLKVISHMVKGEASYVLMEYTAATDKWYEVYKDYALHYDFFKPYDLNECVERAYFHKVFETTFPDDLTRLNCLNWLMDNRESILLYTGVF